MTAPSTTDGPRAPGRWKAVAFAVAFIAISLVAKLVPWWALSFLGETSVARSAVAGMAALAATVALTIFFHRRLPDYESPHLNLMPRLSLHGSHMVLASLCVGVLLFALVFGIATTTGGIHVAWRSSSIMSSIRSFAAVLVATILNAAWEEYTFRGWPFSTCVRTFGPHGVSIGLGAVFGLAHLLNPNWTVAAITSTALAGLLICYTMLAFRNILAPIGLHVGWNYAQSVLTSSRFWTVKSHPNPWLSGGKYGLEASVAGMAVTAAAATLAMFVWSRRTREAAKATEGRISTG